MKKRRVRRRALPLVLATAAASVTAWSPPASATGRWAHHSHNPKFEQCRKQANVQHLHFGARLSFLDACAKK
jgi:hypothetical protein